MSTGTWGRGSTRQSRALRARVLTAHPKCYLRYPGCTRHATEDDHVIPLAEGGTDAWANHNGACHNCHTIKSRAEATRGRSRRTRRHTPRAHPNVP